MFISVNRAGQCVHQDCIFPIQPDVPGSSQEMVDLMGNAEHDYSH